MKTWQVPQETGQLPAPVLAPHSLPLPGTYLTPVLSVSEFYCVLGRKLSS